jgi:DNA-binding NtrC family response regulator
MDSILISQTINALVVDNEPSFFLLLKTILKKDLQFQSDHCCDPSKVISHLKLKLYDIVFLDYDMPGITGLEILLQIKEEFPELPVLMITADTRQHVVTECLKRGAFDFLSKPIDRVRLFISINKAIEHRDTQQQIKVLNSPIKKKKERPVAFINIITNDPKMEYLFLHAQAIAPTHRDIMISGETGTGKELLAQAIHQASRPGKPFVAINVGGLDDQLFADTLFGHTQGAYTGAQKQREGLFAKAGTGTLFLDEIGDLSTSSQVKLLRVLQEREILPIGSDQHQKIKCRVLVASSHDLDELESKGTFRKDLIYRLRTHHLHIPPLRERKTDIGLLFDHFIADAHRQLDIPLTRLPYQVYQLLENHLFPGNVRELESVTFNTVALIKDDLDPISVIRAQLGMVPYINQKGAITNSHGNTSPSEQKFNSKIPFPHPIPSADECVNQLIIEALLRNGNNQTQAAKSINMSRRALINRLQKMNINISRP